MSTPHAAEHRSGAAGDRPDTVPAQDSPQTEGVAPTPGAEPGEPAQTPAAAAKQTPAAEPVRPQRPARPMFGTTVLWSEVFVVFFALLVAYGLRLAEPTVLGILAGVGMVSCAVAARLQRTRAGIVLGSAVQVLLLLGGLLLPTMFVVGGVFAIVWALGVWLGLKIDRERAEREASASTLNAATEGNG